MSEATQWSFGPKSVSVASAMYLIAMKLHAIKEGRAARFMKDVTDILELAKTVGLAIDGPEFRQMCCMKGLSERSPLNETVVFPVLNDIPVRADLTPHDPLAIIRLSEFYLYEIMKREDFEESRLRDKCSRPFELIP